MPSDMLALAIPTYNRPSVLSENLRCMLPELKAHHVPVYISDDSDNEETRRIVENLKLEYDQIYYRRNQPALGHDLNCISTLSWPQTDYVWYMGDSLFFKPGALTHLFSILETRPEFVFINSYVKKDRYESGLILDWKRFFIDTAWYLTLSGATVYSAVSINNIKLNQIDDKKYPNFIQLGIIFEYFSNWPGEIYWCNDDLIEFNVNKKSYWIKNAIKVFVLDWVNLIESFPMFNDLEKKEIIRSHSVETRLFGLKNLIVIRAAGGISVSIWKRHRKDISRVFHTPGWTGLAVSLIPQAMANQLILLSRRITVLMSKLKIYSVTLLSG